MESVSSEREFSRLSPDRVVLGIVVSSIGLFWYTWTSLFDVWHQREGYSHGYLVLAIGLYFLYRERNRLGGMSLLPMPVILTPLLAVSGAWLVAVLASIQVGHQLMLPLLLWLSCLAVCGWRVAKLLAVPIGYLYMAVPIWDVINPGLQNMTVMAVETALRAVGIPTFIDANIVHLPNGVFEIAGGCSGLHFFVVGVAIGVLYSHLYVKGAARIIALVAMSALLAILANWIRVLIVIIAGYATDMDHYLVTVDHYYFGWLVFSLTLIPFFYLANRFEARGRSTGSDAPAQEGTKTAADNVPLVTLATVAMVLIGAPLTFLTKSGPAGTAEFDLVLPPGAGGWQLAAQSETDWKPLFIGPAAESMSVYVKNAKSVTVYANAYRVQTQGRELVGFDNRIEGDGLWVLQQSGRRQIPLHGGGAAPVREAILLSNDARQRVVFYWYNIDGRSLTNDLWTKLTYALLRIVGRPVSGVVAVSTECEADCAAAMGRLIAWLQDYSGGSGDRPQPEHVLRLQQSAAPTASRPY